MESIKFIDEQTVAEIIDEEEENEMKGELNSLEASMRLYGSIGTN